MAMIPEFLKRKLIAAKLAKKGIKPKAAVEEEDAEGASEEPTDEDEASASDETEEEDEASASDEEGAESVSDDKVPVPPEAMKGAKMNPLMMWAAKHRGK